MKKITAIEFTNYKAFYQQGVQNKIAIPEGKNVLIYGENGSGKSSIYEGLRQFFNSSDNTIEEIPSRHIAVAKTRTENEGTAEAVEVSNEVSVKVIFSDVAGDDEKVFGVPTETVKGTNYINRANLLNSFLSYKELLRTYLMDDVRDRAEFRRKFANLLIEAILAKNINSVTQKTYIKSWEELFVPRAWYKEINLESLAKGLKLDIHKINLVLNEILQYFEPNLSVQLRLDNAEIEFIYSSRHNRIGKYPICEVDMDIKLFGLEVENEEENHLTVLNEARLSSLAISIYLASLINTPQDDFQYKILFLDDIFIGLDMSNRLPLLQIISEFRKPIIEQFVDDETNEIVERIQEVNGKKQAEARPFFNDYQIFLSTYDKHWFEIAKNYLSDSKWQSVEMFTHFENDIGFCVPLILTPSLNYYQKAEIYFRKNKESKDYPAAANYLRKECEQQLKRILYGKYLLKNGEKGSTLLKEEIEELRQSFEKLLSDLALDATPYNDFSSIVKATLNPLSHDNLQKPIYKREIEDTFNLT